MRSNISKLESLALARLRRCPADPCDLFALAQILELVEQSAFIVDGKKEFVYINPAFLRLFQHETDSILGHALADLFPAHATQRICSAIRRTIVAGGWSGNLPAQDKKSRRFKFQLTTRALTFGGGSTVYVVGVGKEISTIRRVGKNSTRQMDTSTLSLREQQIFSQLARGECSKTIAARLAISPNTVDTYKRRIYVKLGFHDQNELHRHLLTNLSPL